MSIHTSCPHCERAYHVADTQRGKTIRCKECQGTFKVEDEHDERPRGRKSASVPPAADPGYDAAGAGAAGAGAAGAGAAVDHAPGPHFEEEIPFSRKGLLKSLVWLIAWQLVCLAFAIGMPILGYMAITRERITVESIIPLAVCILAYLVTVWSVITYIAGAAITLF